MIYGECGFGFREALWTCAGCGGEGELKKKRNQFWRQKKSQAFFSWWPSLEPRFITFTPACANAAYVSSSEFHAYEFRARGYSVVYAQVGLTRWQCRRCEKTCLFASSTTRILFYHLKSPLELHRLLEVAHSHWRPQWLLIIDPPPTWIEKLMFTWCNYESHGVWVHSLCTYDISDRGQKYEGSIRTKGFQPVQDGRLYNILAFQLLHCEAKLIFMACSNIKKSVVRHWTLTLDLIDFYYLLEGLGIYSLEGLAVQN